MPLSDALTTNVGALARLYNSLSRPPRHLICTAEARADDFTLTFEYPDGRWVRLYGVTSGCGEVRIGGPEGPVRIGGSQLIAAYFSRLWKQRSSEPPPAQAGASGVHPRCLPNRVTQRDSSATAVLVDGRRPEFQQAMVCQYLLPGLENPQESGTLSGPQVRELVADLTAHMTPTKPSGATLCTGTPGPQRTTLISAVDSWGGRIDLVTRCGFYRFVDDRGAWLWTPSESTSHLLNSVLRPVHHPKGVLEGRLLEVGGLLGAQPRPLSGVVTVRGVSSTHQVRVGRDGRFRVSLLPGRYRVVGSSPSYDGSKPSCHGPHPFVTVRAHATVRVSVTCPIR